MSDQKRFAVFASGNGSNLQAIIDAIENKKIPAQLAVVFSDKADAFALSRASKAKIPSVHLSPKTYPSREAFDSAIVKVMEEHRIDFIVLAGYMRLLSRPLLDRYKGKLINIHPALLPAFKGTHGIRDAFQSGVKQTGVTVHHVVEEMDSGAIIAQETVDIDPKDTLISLEDKIHKVEHVLYPKVIAAFAKTIR